MACRYLQDDMADGMLVAGALLYLDPFALQDSGPMKGAFSPTGQCHTFDADADGYIRGEAINCVYLKRLDDAIRDGDPIRAVIRGSSTTSDGNTASLTQPNSQAQAAAIRRAYLNAGITDFNKTGYLECHGTGTPTGDPLEVAGLASVFAPTRSVDQPLVIGSIKSNVGHSEGAAGLSGLIKTVMAVESGVIPGNPTFIKPTPRIDFEKSRVRPTRRTVRWPQFSDGLRRASVNSFGFGGTNAHVVLEARDSMVKNPKGFVFSSQNGSGARELLYDNETESVRPYILAFSANDNDTLQKNVRILSDHLVDPAVQAKLVDVAYTLSERRTHHFNRGFVTSNTLEIRPDAIITGKKKAQPPRVGFIFTGQGAQWPQMGKDLIAAFPLARSVIESLDVALQTLTNAPKWSILEELTQKRAPEDLRLPEFSQPLVTALQIAQLAVLTHWGISATRVVGHSSGEIAAAVAAKLLTPEEAIKIAYLRGLAAKSHEPEQPLGMLAVGISADAVAPYLESESAVQVACYNSPVSLTLSGQQPALERVCENLKADGHFARMLQVNLAYHSEHIRGIAEVYYRLLQEENLMPTGKRGSDKITMFSSVTGKPMSTDEAVGPVYWRQNMVSPVRFSQAASNMLSDTKKSEFLIEIGPAGALAGPVAQVIKATPGARNAQYAAAAKRGSETLTALYEVAGKLWANAGEVDLAKVNDYESQEVNLIVDLPNYQWNHSRKYWRESLSATEYLHRPFISHDLLGSKVYSVPWHSPTFYKVMELNDLPWLRDHKIGGQVIFPATGYVAMAVEAIHQTWSMTHWKGQGRHQPSAFAYCLKDVQFLRSLALEDNVKTRVSLMLNPLHASPRSWYSFSIRSLEESSREWINHCIGLVRIDEQEFDITAPARALEPLEHRETGQFGYKGANAGELNFGPCFQTIEYFDWTWGNPENRAQVRTSYPPSAYSKQSHYPVHPVAMDSLLQLTGYALTQMQMNVSDDVHCVPAGIGSVVIPARSNPPSKSCMVRSVAHLDDPSATHIYGSRFASASMYDPEDKTLVMQVERVRHDPISTRADQEKHTYMYFGWDANVPMTDANGLNAYLIAKENGKTQPSSHSQRVQKLLNAFANQKPDMAVLEVALGDGDSASLWLEEVEGSSSGPRSGYTQYHYISNDTQSLSRHEETHKDVPRTTWEQLDICDDSSAISTSEKLDLVILKSSHFNNLDVALSKIVADMEEGGKIVVLGAQDEAKTFHDLKQLLDNVGLSQIKDLSPSLGNLAAVAEVPSAASASIDMSNKITCFQFTDNKESALVLESLKERGWNIELCANVNDVSPNSNILVVDELFTNVATCIASQQWESLQALIKKECNMLWVTRGGQMNVTDPNRAAAPGLLRTLRSEELGIRLIALDVEESTGPQTPYSIDQCLRSLLSSQAQEAAKKDSEFAERGGIIYTPRLLPDAALNEAKHEASGGRKAKVEDLHEKKTPVSLGVERVGTIDSLHYCERSSSLLPVKDGWIELEIYAAGVNFKDLAITLGIVPTSDPFVLGGEAAGIVTRVGDGVQNFTPGQRVVAMLPGSFGNRMQVPWQVAHVIPDSLSFEEAATLPVAYLTAMHGLFDLGNLQKGHRVLIHSATGGTGSAAVQLCQYMGAEVSIYHGGT